MVCDVPSGEIVGEEVERKFLIPRAVHIDHFSMGLISVHDELDFAGTVPGEVEGRRRVTEILAIDFHKGALRIGIDRDASVHTARQQQAENHQEHGETQRHRGHLCPFSQLRKCVARHVVGVHQATPPVIEYRLGTASAGQMVVE